MTSAAAAPIENREGEGAGGETSERRSNDAGSFLTALATLMNETVEELERTSTKIGEFIVGQSSRPDHNLVVTLQQFDRLQQEFRALADMTKHFAAATNDNSSGEKWTFHHSSKAMDAITVADLKQRFNRYLESIEIELAQPSMFDEVVF
ncbi:hypothetical protein [Terrarubrum flagellatum]|uniref:hypothetical protein n=1 Tax=Terrirubrum flagellatum TaxID=2895980 RepID=UPI003144DA1E